MSNDTKTCPACKVDKPLSDYNKNKARHDGVDVYCRECYSEKKRLDRIANPEKYAAKRRRSYERNRESELAKKKARYDANPTLFLARGSVSYEKKRDEYRQKRRDYYREHIPESQERVRKRRVMERTAEGSYTKEDIRALYELQDGRCGYCGIPISFDIKGDLHTDHMTPLSRGGTNDIANVCLCCANCNFVKYHKTFEEWKAVRGW